MKTIRKLVRRSMLLSGFILLCVFSVQAVAKLTLVPLIENMPASWAVAVSPNERIFITQRKGVLYSTDINGKNAISYDLQLHDLYYHGQGGLLAIAFAPNFALEPWIYLSYSYGTANANGLKVIRIMLNAQRVLKQETVFEQQDLRDTAAHYAGRLAFLGDGSLLISTGDGFDYREKAQLDNSQLGKILKLSPSGKLSQYSKGHRNPQGLITLNNDTVIAHEHGPDGGDEINVIQQGFNYGWPVITQGKDYIGGLISPFTEYSGMQQPDFDWTPSIAPAGMIYYTHSAIPEFTNTLLVTSLKFRQLHSVALDLSGPKIGLSTENVYFEQSDFRMRDISQTSTGRVFVLSDGDNASILEVLAQ